MKKWLTKKYFQFIRWIVMQYLYERHKIAMRQFDLEMVSACYKVMVDISAQKEKPQQVNAEASTMTVDMTPNKTTA